MAQNQVGYTIIADDSITKLSEAVTALMRKGWSVHGPLFRTEIGMFYQSMILIAE